MYASYRHPQPHLAWHETLEVHELTAFQANHLIGFKMDIHNVKNSNLRTLYAETINSLEQNLKELLDFYPDAPKISEHRADKDMTAFYAGKLLGFAKTSVRNYAIAITETATPQLREVLQKQLNHAIMLHGKAFYFMYENGLYPSYELDQLLANDVKNAKTALNM